MPITQPDNITRDVILDKARELKGLLEKLSAHRGVPALLPYRCEIDWGKTKYHRQHILIVRTGQELYIGLTKPEAFATLTAMCTALELALGITTGIKD